MLILSRLEIKEYLQETYGYSIVDAIDADWLGSQPRNVLYKFAKDWYKPVFSSEQRIVFYGNKITNELLKHIQVCLSKVDISNFFVLICSPSIDQTWLEHLRNNFSTDDCLISHFSITFDDVNHTEINNLINLPDSWCFSPWAHLEITSAGEFKPCCVYSEPIKKDDGTNYNIFSDNVETVYTSQYLKNLRQQFRVGDKPKGCLSCWKIEESNGSANRHWTKQLLGLNADLLNIEEDTLSNLISFDIKLGNLCNFKCRICNESNSSMIAAENIKFYPEDKIRIQQINKQGRWSEDSKLWKNLSEFSNQLINIDFYGGEPFLIREQKILLEKLIESNNAKNIRLHYNSNGSVYPSDLFDFWNHFKEINISFSIDNIGTRFELERANGVWSEVESNLDKFLLSRTPNMSFGIFTTVSIQNVFYIPEIINWYETKKFDSLLFNVLSSPAQLSITNMTDSLAMLVLNKLRTLDSGQIKKYKIENIINLIETSNTEKNSIEPFVKFMLKLDKMRNQQFEISHPEIANAINYSYYRKNNG